MCIRDSNRPTERKAVALGSGFIISEDGYIVTNHHVIDGADEITITLDDQRQFIAELIGSDQRSDLALIKIADIQGVHPISYFELNEDSIKLAENTYKALNKIRPKGNLVGLSVEKQNKYSKISDLIRP